MTRCEMFVYSFSVLQILLLAVVDAGNDSCIARKTASTDSSFTDYAVCTMVGDIYGTIYMRQGASGNEIRYKLGGLSAGRSHENHVHEFGNLFMKTADDLCEATGKLYNPTKAAADGTGANRPIGNLGDICADEKGKANDMFVDDLAMLDGNYSIIGRSIVVHAAEDDHDGHHDDHDHDHGHGKLGCCVIGISDIWDPMNIEANMPIKPGHISGVNKKRIAWVVFVFGFYFWKNLQ